MEPTYLPLPAPTTSSTVGQLTAREGVDIMWRHQLRKESAALLEKLDTSRKLIKDISSDTTRKLQDVAERISTLETKLSTIDNEGKKLREAKRKWDGDVAALKAQMGIIGESYIPESMSFVLTVSILANMNSLAQIMQEPPQPPITIDTLRPVKDTLPSHGSTLISSMRLEKKPTSTEETDRRLLPTQVLCTDIALPAVEHHITANSITAGPRPRSRSKAEEATSLNDHLVEAPQPVNPPRLIQGPNNIISYHNSACIAFASLPKDRHIEIEFIGQFINGIQEAKARKALLDELQKVHPCRTNRDGKVEILCEWADVAEGLNKVGMLPIESVEGTAQNKRVTRKKKILIPKELIESGMVR